MPGKEAGGINNKQRTNETREIRHEEIRHNSGEQRWSSYQQQPRQLIDQSA